MHHQPRRLMIAALGAVLLTVSACTAPSAGPVIDVPVVLESSAAGSAFADALPLELVVEDQMGRAVVGQTEIAERVGTVGPVVHEYSAGDVLVSPQAGVLLIMYDDGAGLPKDGAVKVGRVQQAVDGLVTSGKPFVIRLVAGEPGHEGGRQ